MLKLAIYLSLSNLLNEAKKISYLDPNIYVANNRKERCIKATFSHHIQISENAYFSKFLVKHSLLSLKLITSEKCQHI